MSHAVPKTRSRVVAVALAEREVGWGAPYGTKPTNGKLLTMATKLDPAVWIRDGSFFLRAIDTVDEALLVLDRFHGERGAMFFYARRMLEGARDGRLPMSEARQTFWFFAEDNKLLAESAAA